ncbi:MAG: L-aspartate oxidase [Fibrobacterota bacterium]
MAYTADYMIIGSGIAGLLTALKTAQSGSVLLVTKQDISKGSTKRAQGGITAVIDPRDSFEKHIADTLDTGNGLCDPGVVEEVSKKSPEVIAELLKRGVNFSRSHDSQALNNLDLGREGGHSTNRIVHAKDKTGQNIQEVLIQNVHNEKNIHILQWHSLVELITDHNRKDLNSPRTNRCYGAYLYNRENRSFHRALAGKTVLATGGIGQIYEHTTNPTVSTGDGIAAAFRAGCPVANMEFIQFHPTTLYHPEGKSFLISEALRGYGAVLRNARGKEFMRHYHPRGALAPRDIVARAIDREMKISGSPCVYLDIRHKDAEELQDRFPKIFAKCLSFGINIARDLIPVVPASHYNCGGIWVDTHGQTWIKNLYACGETSHTGMHGANRLASNSLLEAAVYADKTAHHMVQTFHGGGISPENIYPWDDSNTANAEEWVLISHNKQEIKRIMSNYVGIVRTDERLHRALKRILLLREEVEHFYKRTKITTSLLELRNMATVSELIIRSALQRKESRGLHFNKDYPEKNNDFEKIFLITKNSCLD